LLTLKVDHLDFFGIMKCMYFGQPGFT